jgi:hypothetical protein
MNADKNGLSRNITGLLRKLSAPQKERRQARLPDVETLGLALLLYVESLSGGDYL